MVSLAPSRCRHRHERGRLACWARLSGGCPACNALLLVDQHDNSAAGRIAAVVQLQVFALVLVAGGRAVAGGEGEAVQPHQIAAAVLGNAAGLATAKCKQEEGAQRELHCNLSIWVMLTDGGAFYYVGAYLPDLVQPQKEVKKPPKQGRNLGENVDVSRLFQTFREG